MNKGELADALHNREASTLRVPSVVVRPEDPWLVAIKLELLHQMPHLSGRDINQAATAAVVALRKQGVR